LPYFRGRNRLFTISLRAAQRLGPPVVVEIDGFTVQLDLRDGLCRGLWARRAVPQGFALEELCQPGDVVIDAGANIGYMSLLAARAVGPTGRVIAIEPARRAFSLLAANAERNFPDRIVPVRAACDEADGTVTMFVSEYSEEFNSLRPEPVLGQIHEEIVPARSLLSLSRELGINPDVVKIDVEGAEWRVLKGLLQDGAPRPRTLLVEAYEGNSRAFGYLPSALCEWLRDRGYGLSLTRDTERFEYSDTRADGPLLHDVLAVRLEPPPAQT
jgi:FkbM family methyltransferase